MAGTSDIFHDGVAAMGTRLDIVLTGIPRADAEALCGRVFGRIRELETQLSRFIPEGETGLLNRLAHAAPFPAGPLLWRLLGECRRFNRDTDGAFDIALAPLFRRHHDSDPSGGDDARREATAAAGMRRLVFDEAERSVRFTHPDCEIDFGSVGKGLALDEIRPLLKEAGVENGLVSFGESSVLALGRHPYGDHWEIGIRHPLTDDVAGVVRLRDAALSVSGLRRVSRHGVSALEGHIVVPETGRVVERPLTVAVTSASALEAEALSTAWIASGEENPAFLDRFPGIGRLAVDAGNPQPVRLT